ncbi:MAG: hypothetical protein ACF8NJ_00165, partial [Phycisphaerales bacterium JB038]
MLLIGFADALPDLRLSQTRLRRGRLLAPLLNGSTADGGQRAQPLRAIAAITAAAAGAAWALGGRVQDISSPGIRSIAVGVGTSFIAGAVLLPLAFSMDRGMQRLRRYLNRLGEEEEPASFDGPQWLRPLATVCSRSIEQWREKATSAESRLREAQI